MGDPVSDPQPEEDDAFERLRKRRADEKASQQMFAISGAGMEFVAEVAGLTLIGWWIDRSSAMSPLWTLIGAGLGFTVGLYRLVKFAQRNMK